MPLLTRLPGLRRPLPVARRSPAGRRPGHRPLRLRPSQPSQWRPPSSRRPPATARGSTDYLPALFRPTGWRRWRGTSVACSAARSTPTWSSSGRARRPLFRNRGDPTVIGRWSWVSYGPQAQLRASRRTSSTPGPSLFKLRNLGAFTWMMSTRRHACVVFVSVFGESTGARYEDAGWAWAHGSDAATALVRPRRADLPVAFELVVRSTRCVVLPRGHAGRLAAVQRLLGRGPGWGSTNPAAICHSVAPLVCAIPEQFTSPRDLHCFSERVPTAWRHGARADVAPPPSRPGVPDGPHRGVPARRPWRARRGPPPAQDSTSSPTSRA